MSAAAAAGHEQPYDEQIAAIHFLVAAAAAALEQKKRADIYTAATAATPASVLVEHRGLSSLFRIGIPSAGRAARASARPVVFSRVLRYCRHLREDILLHTIYRARFMLHIT